MACGREREWVVSGGVCFGAHPRGPRREGCPWGRGVLAPPRSMVGLSVPATLVAHPDTIGCPARRTTVGERWHVGIG
jgi:hypothetical protein